MTKYRVVGKADTGLDCTEFVDTTTPAAALAIGHHRGISKRHDAIVTDGSLAEDSEILAFSKALPLDDLRDSQLAMISQSSIIRNPVRTIAIGVVIGVFVLILISMAFQSLIYITFL